MVVCNTLPEINELVSPNAGGGASGCAGAAGAAAAGVGGASGIDVAGAGAGAGAAGAGAGSEGVVLLVVSGVLVDAAGVALGYACHLNTASINIIKAINHCAPSIPSTPKSPSP
jgi:hypothetical protein